MTCGVIKCTCQVEALARESGFVDDSTSGKDGDLEDKGEGGQDWSRIKGQDFEVACSDLSASLADSSKKYSRAYCGPIKDRQVRNLDALLAIEGTLITEVRSEREYNVLFNLSALWNLPN